ncbi:MAG: lytic transglycosylase domain-containing protein, partial [Polyangiaceae bacterium]|nr:lytic transglycosylase domain-containing protein [Polyangiaceae bacterium]
AAVGDYGTAVGIGPDTEARHRPRAYEREVEEAAATFGLDPNLLLAIMRVESVYQRGIISYVGAIGLTQIMPRTGTLIAHALGDTDFTTADLLDPATNLRYSAWYLASLIRRFDGRLPLAIASYNGGPHNVRAWLENHARTMPLDALLERIPFEQTHRYVRRVLTHYAAYRAQQGLPMEPLDDTLPTPGADTIAF